MSSIQECVQLYLHIKMCQNKKKILKRRAICKLQQVHRNIQKVQELRMMYLANRDQPINRNLWTLARSSKFWEMEVPTYDEKTFKENFRMSRVSFQKIILQMKNLVRQDTNMRKSINLEKRVAIALYALSSSAEYKTIGNLFGVGRSSVGEIVLEFCDEVSKKLKPIYMNFYPPTSAKIEENVRAFGRMGFPQCFGAIDGCHIEVCPPKEDATDYYNFKGWYSIILFAAVDYRFMYTNIGATGRNNDSFIFEKSYLKQMHESLPEFKQTVEIEGVQIPIVLLGDSAFRLSSMVLKPYPFVNEQPPAEKMFNKNLSKCRRVVENAFGQLKARFRRLGKGLEVHVDNAYKIVEACCILHNFCNNEQDPIIQAWLDEGNTGNLRRQPQQTTIVGNRNREATQIRNAITKQMARQLVDADPLSCDGSMFTAGRGVEEVGGNVVGIGDNGITSIGGNNGGVGDNGEGIDGVGDNCEGIGVEPDEDDSEMHS